ncbi:MAG: EAL domain-containing protein [Bdellovibrionales bacterium]
MFDGTFSPAMMTQMLALTATVVTLFIAGSAWIIWREARRRELAEAALAGVRQFWRPLNFLTARTFRPIAFTPKTVRIASKTRPQAAKRETPNLLLADLRRAVYFAPEQFAPVLTTYYDINTHERAAYRAAFTWQHPVFGDQPLESTLQLAADNDLARPMWLGFYRQAMTSFARKGMATTLKLPLPAALHGWCAAVTPLVSMARSCGVIPDRITFCIESNGATKGSSLHHQTLALRAQGFGIALDNCGAGAGALTHLPVTEVIAARALVESLHTDLHAMAMLKQLADMAGNLAADFTAEGVANATDHAALALVGCTTASGNYFKTGIPGQRMA